MMTSSPPGHAGLGQGHAAQTLSTDLSLWETGREGGESERGRKWGEREGVGERDNENVQREE